MLNLGEYDEVVRTEEYVSGILQGGEEIQCLVKVLSHSTWGLPSNCHPRPSSYSDESAYSRRRNDLMVV